MSKLKALAILTILLTIPATTLEAKDKDSYTVVQIANTSGQVSFEVLETKNLKNKAKELKQEYAEAVKAYKEDRKKNGKKATAPKPKRPSMKKLKGPLKSEDEANKVAGQFREKWEKAKKKGKKKS